MQQEQRSRSRRKGCWSASPTANGASRSTGKSSAAGRLRGLGCSTSFGRCGRGTALTKPSRRHAKLSEILQTDHSGGTCSSAWSTPKRRRYSRFLEDPCKELISSTYEAAYIKACGQI